MSEAASSSIVIPNDWSNGADSIAGYSTSPPPIVVICGPKNSGKSTFSRFLLNTLLPKYKEVAYLDTDVGQPEFTTPACLSLHIFNHQVPVSDLTTPCLKKPERCYFYGDVSSKTDPEAYLKNISSLYDHFRFTYYMSNEGKSSEKISLPLVVNTPGWVKGIGYHVLVKMLTCIRPTHVVQIRITAENKNLPKGAFWLDERGDEDHVGLVELIEINAACRDSFNRSVLVKKNPKYLRDLRLAAYFRQCFPRDSNISTFKELALALSSHPPYEVSISSFKITHLHCEVPSSEIFYSLNATIIGLGVSSAKLTNSKEHCAPLCVGLGLVRAVDASKELLFILTPVPVNSLEEVDHLLQGYISIPICLLQVQECRSPYMCANVLPYI